MWSRRAVTQSPEVSMVRAIVACVASTSSIRDGRRNDAAQVYDGGNEKHSEINVRATSVVVRWTLGIDSVQIFLLIMKRFRGFELGGPTCR